MNQVERAPKGKVAVWLKRLGDFGFVLALIYTGYLLLSAGMNSWKNSQLEDRNVGSSAVAILSEDGVIREIGADRGAFAVQASELYRLDSEKKKRAFIMWATWCGPCHSLLVDLAASAKDKKFDPSDVIAINVGETKREVIAYLKQSPLPFRVALDPEDSAARQFKVGATPTIILVDEAGKIIRVSTGGFRLASAVENHLAM